MHAKERRCLNCNAPTSAALCAPCEQDRILEQQQLVSGTTGRGLRCTD